MTRRAHPTLPLGHWWACENPERPPELDRVHALDGCLGCAVYRQAATMVFAGWWE